MKQRATLDSLRAKEKSAIGSQRKEGFVWPRIAQKERIGVHSLMMNGGKVGWPLLERSDRNDKSKEETAGAHLVSGLGRNVVKENWI